MWLSSLQILSVSVNLIKDLWAGAKVKLSIINSEAGNSCCFRGQPSESIQFNMLDKFNSCLGGRGEAMIESMSFMFIRISQKELVLFCFSLQIAIILYWTNLDFSFVLLVFFYHFTSTHFQMMSWDFFFYVNRAIRLDICQNVHSLVNTAQMNSYLARFNLTRFSNLLQTTALLPHRWNQGLTQNMHQNFPKSYLNILLLMHCTMSSIGCLISLSKKNMLGFDYACASLKKCMPIMHTTFSRGALCQIPMQNQRKKVGQHRHKQVGLLEYSLQR